MRQSLRVSDIICKILNWLLFFLVCNCTILVFSIRNNFRFRSIFMTLGLAINMCSNGLLMLLLALFFWWIVYWFIKIFSIILFIFNFRLVNLFHFLFVDWVVGSSSISTIVNEVVRLFFDCIKTGIISFPVFGKWMYWICCFSKVNLIGLFISRFITVFVVILVVTLHNLIGDHHSTVTARY